MIRRALIIYCDDVQGEKVLPGPPSDNANYCEYLQSKLGGEWLPDEIKSLHNPTSFIVSDLIKNHLNGSDYTFIIYTGHGYSDPEKNNMQYVALANVSIPISKLKTTAIRQSIIIDACRKEYSPSKRILRTFSAMIEDSKGFHKSTRELFDKHLLNSDEGITILYAATINQSARDSERGAAYLQSLLKAAKIWKRTDNSSNVLTIEQAHIKVFDFIYDDFITTQIPEIEPDKRNVYFPFAVKYIPLKG